MFFFKLGDARKCAIIFFVGGVVEVFQPNNPMVRHHFPIELAMNWGHTTCYLQPGETLRETMRCCLKYIEIYCSRPGW